MDDLAVRCAPPERMGFVNLRFLPSTQSRMLFISARIPLGLAGPVLNAHFFLPGLSVCLRESPDGPSFTFAEVVFCQFMSMILAEPTCGVVQVLHKMKTGRPPPLDTGNEFPGAWT